MPNQKILYVTTELAPYQEESSIGRSVHEMALKMYAAGNDVRIFMPRFGLISERKFQLHEVIRLSGMNIIINDIDQPLLIKVASLPGERLQVYFIDNEEYFKRKAFYTDENNISFEDNDERAIFFARGVIETIKKLNWVPDVIHLNGWMSYMIPVYLKTFYQNDNYFKDSKILGSVYEEVALDMSATFKEKLSFDKVNIESLLNGTTNQDVLLTGAGMVDTALTHGKISKSLAKKLEDAKVNAQKFPGVEDLESLYN